MSFICLPQDFDAKTGRPLAFQIAMNEEGVLTPVGFMRGSRELPVDLARLSENFAAMLNGNKPLYRLGEDYQMFYEKHDGGMNLRFRKSQEDGVSEVGALFTLLPGIEMDIDDAH